MNTFSPPSKEEAGLWVWHAHPKQGSSYYDQMQIQRAGNIVHRVIRAWVGR
jgi:hypothetical protein